MCFEFNMGWRILVFYLEPVALAHVDLRRESQSHAPAHVLMRLYPIDKSLVCLQIE